MSVRSYCDECGNETPQGFTPSSPITVTSDTGKDFTYTVMPGRAILCDTCSPLMKAKLKAAL